MAHGLYVVAWQERQGNNVNTHDVPVMGTGWYHGTRSRLIIWWRNREREATRSSIQRVYGILHPMFNQAMVPNVRHAFGPTSTLNV